MKKMKYVILLLLAVVVFPFSVFAEGEEVIETNEDSKKVNVYLFRGEGCPHCQEAEEWFKSIEGEYGEYFHIIDYEIWNNEDNAALMQDVAEARGEKAEGVPYIVIGNKSWNGFAESYEGEIIDQIKSEFAKNPEDRYDITKLLMTLSPLKKKIDLAGIISFLVIAGIIFVVYKARQAAN